MDALGAAVLVVGLPLAIAVLVYVIDRPRRPNWKPIGRDAIGKTILRRWRNRSGKEAEVRADELYGGAHAPITWYDTSTGAVNYELGELSEDAERVLMWEREEKKGAES